MYEPLTCMAACVLYPESNAMCSPAVRVCINMKRAKQASLFSFVNLERVNRFLSPR